MRALSLFIVAILTVLSPGPQGVIAEALDPSSPDSNHSLPAIIDLNNYSDFKEQIPVELFVDLSSGLFAFQPDHQGTEVFRFDKGWMNAAQGVSQFRIGKEREIVGDAFLPNGPAFAVDLSDKSPESFDSTFATQLLWNTFSNWWRLGMLRAEFSLLTLEDEQLISTLEGSVQRLFPSVYSEPLRRQFFRERFTLRVPESGHVVERLTFRLFGAREDTVWSSSPALQSVRRITGSNRADSLPFSVASLDDFFTFSGKVELQKPSEVTLHEVFVPFLDDELRTLSVDQSGCLTLQVPPEEAGGRDSRYRWNFESRALSTGAGWLPVHARYHLRRVWRVVSLVGDPFSLEGWQVLYIDQQTLLPVYRFIFDKTGRQWKSVFSGFGIAEGGDGALRTAYPSFTVVRDHVADKASLIDFHSFAVCPENLGERESAFLPSALEPQVGEQQPELSSEKPTA